MQALLYEIIQPQNLLFYIFSYGLASIPTSYLVARLIHRVNIRKRPLHSHTASYIWKTVSKPSSVLVVILDILKGLVPCAIAHSLNTPVEVIALIGLFAVVGHCFSLWLNFFGGLGGATMAGAMFMVFWPSSIAMIVANFLLIIFGVSAGAASIFASVLGAVVIFIFVANKAVWLMVSLTVAMIFVRQRLWILSIDKG